MRGIFAQLRRLAAGQHRYFAECGEEIALRNLLLVLGGLNEGTWPPAVGMVLPKSMSLAVRTLQVSSIVMRTSKLSVRSAALAVPATPAATRAVAIRVLLNRLIGDSGSVWCWMGGGTGRGLSRKRANSPTQGLPVRGSRI